MVTAQTRALIDEVPLERQPCTNSDTDAELLGFDPSTGTRSKSLGELLTAYMVYSLCSIDTLVRAAPAIIGFMEDTPLAAPMNWVIKQTFFSLFCGGETPEEVIPTIHRLSSRGVGSCLDISVEADLPADEQDTAETRMQWNAIADQCMEAFEKSIVTAGRARYDAFAAIKVTALTAPAFLHRFSMLLDTTRSLFSEAANVAALPVGKLTLEPFTDNDMADYRTLMQRMTDLCTLADQYNTRLMIDAEQSYFQACVDHVALAMCERFNNLSDNAERRPLVLNTYQMYLRDGMSKVVADREYSKRFGFILGAKLVRGAYMVSERKRSAELDLPDPIHRTINDTHTSYDAGVTFLINEIVAARDEAQSAAPGAAVNTPALFVASHNRNSVERAAMLLASNDISKSSANVMFGQLYGMQDAITYSLGNAGYPIYKYIPYGPVEEVIPYLLRRVQENSAILGGGSIIERQAVVSELKRRAMSPMKMFLGH
ncbi:FAD-linked oxidoreductase [Ramicandelaber brevisporus]|nr:FAD-linked oxidoreductase [Ramicandelaber brevisporus]